MRVVWLDVKIHWSVVIVNVRYEIIPSIDLSFIRHCTTHFQYRKNYPRDLYRVSSYLITKMLGEKKVIIMLCIPDEIRLAIYGFLKPNNFDGEICYTIFQKISHTYILNIFVLFKWTYRRLFLAVYLLLREYLIKNIQGNGYPINKNGLYNDFNIHSWRQRNEWK